MTLWIAAYAALGLFSGFFAGLLGIGGGAVMVPILALLFAAQDFPHSEIMHLALGSSMATILFTSLSSLGSHHRHQAVRWEVVRQFTPGILVGTLVGAVIARVVDTTVLATIFTAFIAANAINLFLDRKPPPNRSLPGPAGLSIAGLVIGTFSSLVAIGGAALSVPYMTWCNVRIQQAIGTAAALGFPIALGGSLGYILNGLHATDLPPGSLGYLFLPALFALVPCGMIMAPVGARYAHRLPVATLKKIFATVLVVLAAKMLHGLMQAGQ